MLSLYANCSVTVKFAHTFFHNAFVGEMNSEATAANLYWRMAYAMIKNNGRVEREVLKR